jgi:pSer/pThr/pTyr-binding forkhead associated (FHA) protein
MTVATRRYVVSQFKGNMSNTMTAPEHDLPPTLQSPDLVTALRAYGCPGEYPLSTGQVTFAVGSASACGVRIASEYVSSKHCLLVRRERHLRVHDLDSRNGTYFRGHKEIEFEIAPGDTFNVATTRLVALNEAMRVARPVLTEVLGYDQESVIDDVIINAVLDSPVLVVGPPGGGQLDLVRAIHEMSIRRDHSFIAIGDQPATQQTLQQLFDDAHHGTLVIPATGKVLDGTLLETILSHEHDTRLVLLAPSFHAAMRSVCLTRLTSMNQIEIRPLRERTGDIPRLLERNFAKNGADIRFADLRPENQDKLLHHNWLDNLEELRQIGAMIAALMRHSSIRKAADAVNMPRSTMQAWIKKFQVTHPPTAPASPPSLECPAIQAGE